MALTKIQPSGLDTTQTYSVDQVTANTVVVSGVSIKTYADSSYTQANAANNLSQSAYNKANTGFNIYGDSGVSGAGSLGGGFVVHGGGGISTNASGDGVTVDGSTIYNQANSANTLAQAAYNAANTSTSSIDVKTLISYSFLNMGA